MIAGARARWLSRRPAGASRLQELESFDSYIWPRVDNSGRCRQWVAYLAALAGSFAVLSLAVPSIAASEAPTVMLLAVGCYVAALLLWRWSKSGMGLRLAVLVVDAIALGAAAVMVAVLDRPAAHGSLALDRAAWLWLLGTLVVAAVVIRRLFDELRRGQAQLWALSRSDALTGLASPHAFAEELGRELARSRRDGGAPCVALLDLDCFKAYNEMRGYREGDRLLRRTAQLWKSMVREVDLIARQEGERFAVLIRQCHLDDAVRLVERLRAVIPEEQTSSAGLARWEHEESAQRLVERAEAALLRAKAAGRNRIKIAEVDCLSASGDASHWPTVVHRMLDDRSVVAAYQPVIRLSDGQIVAYEALARPDARRVDISVDRMFSTAHQLGLTRDLDWLCRRAALADGDWIPPGVPLLINCSISGLVDPLHRADQMLLLLAAAGRTPRDVVLEITERELVGDLGRLRSVVGTYRREGFRFAVDDVGEGNSTLQVLAVVAPEFVKIARSLVVDASTGARAAIRALVAFAAELGASVIAEGIEVPGTATRMQELGVDLAQGFLFGRPKLAAVLRHTVGASPEGSRPPGILHSARID